MPRTAIAAAALLSVMLAAAPGAQAQEEGWACEKPAAFDPGVKQHIARLAHNREMEVIVKEYMARWDAQYIRAQCEAFASGLPHSIICLNGRRDWAEIEAAIPAEYSQLDRKALRPFMRKERDTPSGRREAVMFCRDVGAIATWRQ